ncbi:MAG: protein kinase [Candidatus Competibacteraceae bacterium]|nr:protein kinase [Candidatus Competibacteraceae bacterium]
MRIPGYQIERELGQGGMAIVYLAIQESLNRHVALKIIKPVLTTDEEFSHRFLREGRLIAQLNDPNIITVYDIGSHDNIYYLSMEYVPGGTLQQRIREGLPLKGALSVSRAIARALQYAHSRNIIHRDIKPQNILFRENGSPVLTDFGIAKTLGGNTIMTRTGLSIGTPRYMSPEQIRGQTVDARADLYSLGVLFYEMLTGHVPYAAEDSFAVAMMHVTSPIPELPPELARYQPLLNKLLEKEAGQRFQTGQEFLAALDAAETAPANPGLSQETLVPAVGAASPSTRQDGRKAGWLLPAVALAGAVLGGGYLALNRSDAPVAVTPPPATETAAVDPEIRRRNEAGQKLDQAIERLQAGALEDSLAQVEQGLRIAPDHAALKALRERVNQQIADRDRARQLSEHQRQARLQADQFLEQAQRTQQEGALEMSLVHIEQGLQAVPDHAPLLALKKAVLAQQAERQRQEKAARLQLEAAERQKAEAERHRAEAERQRAEAERERAEAEQRRRRSDDFLRRALGYQRDRAYEASLVQIEQGLQLTPDHARLLALREDIRGRLRELKEPPPAPAPAPVPDEAARLAALLKTCDAHLKANRLTSGKGGNAADCYREALDRDQGNSEALTGLARVADRYADLADAGLRRKNLNAARDALDKLAELNASHVRLAELRERLDETETALKPAAPPPRPTVDPGLAAEAKPPSTAPEKPGAPPPTARAEAGTPTPERAGTPSVSTRFEPPPTMAERFDAPVPPVRPELAPTPPERPKAPDSVVRAEPAPAPSRAAKPDMPPIDLVSVPQLGLPVSASVSNKASDATANLAAGPLASAAKPDLRPIDLVSTPLSAKPPPAKAPETQIISQDRHTRVSKTETEQEVSMLVTVSPQGRLVDQPAVAPESERKPATPAQAWAAVRNSTNPADLERFLEAHPKSRYASAARAKLDRVKQQPAIPARLAVRANVEEAQVTVNGRNIGTTPVEVEVKPGSYKVRVSLDGYQDWNGQVDLAAGDDSTLSATLPKKLAVATAAPAASPRQRPPEPALEPEPDEEETAGPPARQSPPASARAPEPQAERPAGQGANCVRGNCLNGQGNYRHPDGSEYIGEFRNARMHGQGTYIYPGRREKYIGGWSNGVISGQGTYYYRTGNRYQGQWRNGRKSGQGTYFYAGGEKYVGDFENDEPNGQGVYYYSNGDRYEGEWRNGRKNGRGVLYEDGKRIIGEWRNDQKVQVTVEQ